MMAASSHNVAAGLAVLMRTQRTNAAVSGIQIGVTGAVFSNPASGGAGAVARATQLAVQSGGPAGIGNLIDIAA